MTAPLLPLAADDLLATTRSVRRRLDLTRPVPLSVVEECIAIALQAPTASNTQGWHWIVVTEPAMKSALAELYRSAFDAGAATSGDDTQDRQTPTDGPIDPRADAIITSAVHLRDHLHEVPALVLPCHVGRPGTSVGEQAAFWGSIFPAVWSFQLALRARGLGSTLTTLHLRHEREAAEILGLPADGITQAGLLPVAFTVGTDFRPARRTDPGLVTHIERW